MEFEQIETTSFKFGWG